MYQIAAGHPALSGHFPHNPVVPGAVLLSYLAQHACQQGVPLAGLRRCKFLQILKPQQPFSIELDGQTGKFSIVADTGSVIATGLAIIGDSNGS